MQEKLKNKKGITLIALVITIIILLILAVVSIGALAGNDGLFGKTKDAEKKWNLAQEKENNTLDEYAKEIDKYLGGGTPSFTNIDTAETNPAGALPSGKVTALESDATKGIVIKDKNDNEWTWVVVPKSIYTNATYNGGTAPTSSEDYTKIASVMASYASDYRDSDYSDTWYDGCGLTPSQYETNYQKMLTSVYTNGGFWIARYEAGIEGSNAAEVTTGRTASSKGNISTKAVSQKDMIPYDYVTVNEAQTLASNMSPDSNKTSSLLFGIQWDLTCKYLEEKSTLTESDINSNSTSWGNYKNTTLQLSSGKYAVLTGSEFTPWKAYTITTDDYVENQATSNGKAVYLTAGASSKTSVLNISDFAGNAYEWTLEYSGVSDYPCSIRGGDCNYGSGSTYPAAHRLSGSTSDSDYTSTFRVVLY